MGSSDQSVQDETDPLMGGQQDVAITHAEILTVWTTAIETQKHFAELSIKMRQVGLTLTGAILAVAIILLRDETLATLTFFCLSIPLVSLVFFTASGVLQAANILDTHVYHKMLRGAVKFNELFEDKHAERLFGTVGMTQTISAYSRAKNTPNLNEETKEWEYSSPKYAASKISMFYHVPSFLLVLLGVAFIWSANINIGGVDTGVDHKAVAECEDSD